MDEIELISRQLEAIFRILRSFKHLSDAYVIEFFTRHLWTTLPACWRGFFDQIDHRTLGRLLDLERSSISTSIVPPLNLLSLRRCAQVYSLRRTPMITNEEVLNYLDKKAVSGFGLGTGSGSGYGPGLGLGPGPGPVHGHGHGPGPGFGLGSGHGPGHGHGPAHAHEPGRGSGHGPEFGNEGKAEKPEDNMEKRIGHVKKAAPPPCSLFHMSPKKKHEIGRLSNLVDLLIGSLRNDEYGKEFSLLDIGSGCGHLARYLSLVKGINVTTVESKSYFIERAKIFDQKTASRLQRWKEDEFVFPIHRNEFFHNSASPTILPHSDTMSPHLDKRVWLLGLHTCGDLAPSILQSFISDQSVQLLISISCCYMKLTTKDDRVDVDSGKDGHIDVDSIKYPLSTLLKASNGHQLSYAAREMACHATEQYSSKLRSMDESELESLKVHSYRAALEALIIYKYPDRVREQIRSVKNAHRITLMEYAKLAMSRLEDVDVDAILEERYVEEWSERVKKEWKRVLAFYSVRLLLAPLIESAILLDRLLYLKECGIRKSWIVPIFDPNISARNLMLIAAKEASMGKTRVDNSTGPC